MSQTVIRAALTEAQTALQNLLANQETLSALEKAGDTLVESFKNGGRVFSCGNGGSMCDAMHFAEEFTGRYRKNRRRFPRRRSANPVISPASPMILAMTISSPPMSKRMRGQGMCCWQSAPAGKARMS